MATWNPAIPSIIVPLAADGISSAVASKDTIVDYNDGKNADTAWTIKGMRLKSDPASTELLLVPAVFTFVSLQKQPSPTKKRCLLRFDGATYNERVKAEDPAALSLASALNGGRLELDVEVRPGLPAQMLSVDLRV